MNNHQENSVPLRGKLGCPFARYNPRFENYGQTDLLKPIVHDYLFLYYWTTGVGLQSKDIVSFGPMSDL